MKTKWKSPGNNVFADDWIRLWEGCSVIIWQFLNGTQRCDCAEDGCHLEQYHQLSVISFPFLNVPVSFLYPAFDCNRIRKRYKSESSHSFDNQMSIPRGSSSWRIGTMLQADDTPLEMAKRTYIALISHCASSIDNAIILFHFNECICWILHRILITNWCCIIINTIPIISPNTIIRLINEWMNTCETHRTAWTSIKNWWFELENGNQGHLIWVDHFSVGSVRHGSPQNHHSYQLFRIVSLQMV